MEDFVDMLAGQAMQDQELARGVAWFLGSDKADVRELWDMINDQDVASIRKADGDRLKVIAALACIGMFEVLKADRGGSSTG
jgi:hypothetical protein